LRLPVVASRSEVKALLDQMSGRERFMAALLYGTGMRLRKCTSGSNVGRNNILMASQKVRSTALRRDRISEDRGQREHSF